MASLFTMIKIFEGKGDATNLHDYNTSIDQSLDVKCITENASMVYK